MKILYVTTIGMTMGFFTNLIRQLMNEGHTVDIATNETTSEVPAIYRELDCKVHPLSCSRSPFDKGNITAIGQIRKLVADHYYDVVHCHTPIAAACVRLACRKARRNGTRVFYTAHGFHFYKGAPLLNWVMYYPVEKLCAHFTDVLITINKEDYERATRKLKAKQIAYIPGVGVPISKYRSVCVDRHTKRCELGIPDEAIVLLSVGEINDNKNQKVIIQAMARLDDPTIHYLLAGTGPNEQALCALAEELGVSERVHLLGYRTDVAELCVASDIFCFPSYREGLGLAAIEAMSCGLPLITSNVHGINDYSQNELTGFKCEPDDIEGFSQAIGSLALSSERRAAMGAFNREAAQKYDVENIIPLMKKIYGV